MLFNLQVEVSDEEWRLISVRLGRAIGLVAPDEVELFLAETVYAKLASLTRSVISQRYPLTVAAELARGADVGQRLYRLVRERLAMAGESDQHACRIILGDVISALRQVTQLDHDLADVLTDHVIAVLDAADDRIYVELLAELAELRHELELRRDAPPCRTLVPPRMFARTRQDSARQLFLRAYDAVHKDVATLRTGDLAALARAAEEIEPSFVTSLSEEYVLAAMRDAERTTTEAEHYLSDAVWEQARYHVLRLEMTAEEMITLGHTESAVQCLVAAHRILNAHEVAAHEDGSYVTLRDFIARSSAEVRVGCERLLVEINESIDKYNVYCEREEVIE